jgi:hypothetical protein
VLCSSRSVSSCQDHSRSRRAPPPLQKTFFSPKGEIPRRCRRCRRGGRRGPSRKFFFGIRGAEVRKVSQRKKMFGTAEGSCSRYNPHPPCRMGHVMRVEQEDRAEAEPMLIPRLIARAERGSRVVKSSPRRLHHQSPSSPHFPPPP